VRLQADAIGPQRLPQHLGRLEARLIDGGRDEDAIVEEMVLILGNVPLRRREPLPRDALSVHLLAFASLSLLDGPRHAD
jgi:hypothetical protein